MAVITRSQWGAGPHRAGVIPLPVRELWLHHGVVPFWTGAQAARNLQAIARSRNFVDISYSWLGDRQGNEIEGRGWGRQGAHTAGRNSISHALCLVGNLETSAMPDGMIRGAVRLVRRHRVVGPGRITGPHSAAPGASTACPGRFARPGIQAINAAASGTVTPPPQEVDMSFTEKDRSLLEEVTISGRANNEPKSGHYTGRVIREIREDQVNSAQKAVDQVMKYYAAAGDSPLHKIIRDVINET